MDEKTKKEFILLLNQCFREIVVPAIEDLHKVLIQNIKKISA